MRGRRDDVVLATKFSGAMGGDPNRRGNSRRWIVTAVEDSLRRLRVDHIDLYQIHHPDPGTDIEETLAALTDLLRSGKVRAIGSSNFPAPEIVEAQWVAERRGLARLRTEQSTYSILNRAVEREVLPVCERYGIGTLVYSPLAGGMLAGRYRKGRRPDSGRMKWVPRYLTDERALDLVERIIALAGEAGMPVAHLALAFAISHPGVTSAIIGPRTMEQLEDLLEATDVVLDDDLLDRIDALAPPGTDVAALDIAYQPPALRVPALRRRPARERAAA
ncbi:aldo/keto reductase [Micromonospora okii]|uniref:aldo/keto reductase n=1 Tax=Micromonospora okii TaxID=1182970 RepID=UPI001E3998A0